MPTNIKLVDKRYLIVPEVAEIARVSSRTVWNWIRDGRLQVVRAGRRVLIPTKELERFLSPKDRVLSASRMNLKTHEIT